MRVHTAWLKSLVETAPSAVIDGRSQVFVTKAEYPAPDSQVKLSYPYWVIHPWDGKDTTDRFTGPRLVQHPGFTVWSVALSGDKAAAAGEAVKNLLVARGVGVVPSIEGERSSRVRYSVPIPIQSDKNASPPICYHVAEIGFDSELI